jgi:hypothetical protein
MIGEKKSLKDLRRGIPPHKRVHIGGADGYDVMVVILSADKCLEIEEQTQDYCSSRGSKANENVKNQFYNALLVANCMRDPDDLTVPIASSLNEVMECMDLEDINRVVNAYGELMMNKAPKLELLTQEQLETVKKHLEVTPLSDLSTVLLVHLANCHQTIVSEK